MKFHKREFMKACPKCGELHDKVGTFCSRKCANSRVQTEEANADRREKLAGKISATVLTAEEKLQASNKKKETWKQKRHAAPFNELGWDIKRKVVIEQQEHKCSRCGISEWMNNPISLEVDHIDGDNSNDDRSNLEALCPNCHSQTSTWRGRNKTKVQVTDADLKTALENSKNIRQALILVGLSPKGDNYKRASKLLGEMKDK